MAVKKAAGSLQSYPSPPGNRPWRVFDLQGVNPYAPIVVAAPPTGGQVVKASDMGLSSIECAFVMGSDNGQYTGVCYPSVNTNGAEFGTMLVQWIVSATGAEAAAIDLTGRSLRILVLGNN